MRNSDAGLEGSKAGTNGSTQAPMGHFRPYPERSNVPGLWVIILMEEGEMLLGYLPLLTFSTQPLRTIHSAILRLRHVIWHAESIFLTDVLIPIVSSHTRTVHLECIESSVD